MHRWQVLCVQICILYDACDVKIQILDMKMHRPTRELAQPADATIQSHIYHHKQPSKNIAVSSGCVFYTSDKRLLAK